MAEAPAHATPIGNRPRASYVAAFDGLRAVSITGVIVVHTFSSGSGPVWEVLRRGWYGVDIFFVLSGFLITWILASEMERDGSIRLSRFYLRRALRIQPAYFSALVIFAGLILFSDSDFRPVLATIPLYLTFSFNLAIPYLGGIPTFLVAWSLCIEEQFYFLWPWGLNKLTLRRAMRFLLWAIAAVTIYRTAAYTLLNSHFAHRPPNGDVFGYRTDLRIDPILIGCALALMLRSEKSRYLREWLSNSHWFPTAAVLMSGAVIWPMTGSAALFNTVGSTLAAASVAVLIAALFLNQSSWPARMLALGPMVLVGKVSYGIYLFHGFAVPALAAMLGLPRSARSAGQELLLFLLTFAVSTFAAWLHYNLVERRFLALRERLDLARGSLASPDERRAASSSR